jgi:microcystin degradation protein MlrC
MTKRLAVARFWFEGNAFSPVPTTLASFREREWTKGRVALDAARGSESELAAIADFAAAHPEWDVTVARCCSANPGGSIDDDAFAALRDELATDLAGGRWDAVYLSPHGAAIARSEPAADLALVRAVAAVTRCPLGASFDLHANLDPAIAAYLAAASGYRTYPHVDMKATAARVLGQLRRAAGCATRPQAIVQPLHLLLPSFNMRTSAGPMAEVLAAARRLEREPLLDISVFGGFPYADTAATGASVLVVADGAADTPGLFRALLRLRPRVRTVFAYFSDEAAAAAAHVAGAGAAITVTLGSKRSAAFGPGVRVDARVVRVGRARFVNQGPMERRLAVDLGKGSVLYVDGIKVIVTSRVGAANDPAFFAAHGIDLATIRLLCVKAKNHFRAAFEPLCAAIVDVDCPGPARADLAALPFRNARVAPA